jgi:hypothetical protein
MPRDPIARAPSITPLLINGAIAASIGLLYLIFGSETAILMLFLIGLIYIFGALFVVCTALLIRTAIFERRWSLAGSAIASVAYLGVWTYAATSGEISHGARVYAVAFLSSFAYLAIALLVARRVQKKAASQATT